MPVDVDKVDSPLTMRIISINFAALLRQIADKHLKVARKRYELDYDKKERLEPTYALRD